LREATRFVASRKIGDEGLVESENIVVLLDERIDSDGVGVVE